jgi:hypothetical protein
MCDKPSAFDLTLSNIKDHRPISGLNHRLFGKFFGDQGYISQLSAE